MLCLKHVFVPSPRVFAHHSRQALAGLANLQHCRLQGASGSRSGSLRSSGVQEGERQDWGQLMPLSPVGGPLQEYLSRSNSEDWELLPENPKCAPWLHRACVPAYKQSCCLTCCWQGKFYSPMQKEGVCMHGGVALSCMLRVEGNQRKTGLVPHMTCKTHCVCGNCRPAQSEGDAAAEEVQVRLVSGGGDAVTVSITPVASPLQSPRRSETPEPPEAFDAGDQVIFLKTSSTVCLCLAMQFSWYV